MNASDLDEHFKKLGIKPGMDQTPETIKKAWRNKCKSHHPDKGGDPKDFVDVTHSYKMLTDPTYRYENELKKSPSEPDLNLQMQLPVSFEEAFFGRQINVSYNQLEIGDDFEVVTQENHKILHINFTLPRGCFDGHHLRKPGFGHRRGDKVGDAIIRVIPKRHPRFRVVDSDIHTTEQVPLDIALKGGEVEVQTMYGLRTLRVPPGTKPDDQLKIKTCGVGGYGHHIVTVDVLFPDKAKLKSAAWKGLDINWDTKPETEDVTFEQMFWEIKQKRGL